MNWFMNFKNARSLATHNLKRHKARTAVMAVILALVIAAYLVVMPIMEALARDASAKTADLDIPCDLALVIGHAIVYSQPNTADPTKSQVMTLCPAATDRRLPWDSLKGFESVEFVTIEKAYTSLGTMDVLHGCPDAKWFTSCVSIDAGRQPKAADEVIIPAWYAQQSGLERGDTLGIDYARTPLHQFERAEYTVVGVFSTSFLLADAPIVYQPARHQHHLSDMNEYKTRGTGARLLALFDLGGQTPKIPNVRKTLTDAFVDAGRLVAPEARYRIDIITGFTRETPALMARALAQDVQMPALNALFLAFVFVAVGLFTVMLMSFLERKRDIAIMKTVGITNDEVASVVMVETIVVAALGITLGFGLSFLLVRSFSGSALAPVLAFRWSYAVKASVIGVVVIGLAALFPVSLARLATVNQLLFDQKIYLFHKKVMPEKRHWRIR